MDHCLSSGAPFSHLQAWSFSPRSSSLFVFPAKSSAVWSRGISSISTRRAPPSFVVVAAGARGEFSGLHAPVQPKSAAGRLLSGVLLNDPGCFNQAAEKQLELLAVERYAALARMDMSCDSDEACLHRRIAEMRECECLEVAEEVMYMMICSKFYEIGVHLVPQLSKCICNDRLEIMPSKDWELESIHSIEFLDLIKEHLSTFVGCRTSSNVADNWKLTEIPRLQLCRIYTASVLYGYFLKSSSLRHTLEKKLFQLNHDLGLNIGSCFPTLDTPSLGAQVGECGRLMRTRSTSVGEVPCSLAKKRETLRGYITGFDPENFQICAKPRSKEAANVIKTQISELFKDDKTGLLENEEVIHTSFGSLKRFALEGVAFGSFLWDSEEFMSNVYELMEN